MTVEHGDPQVEGGGAVAFVVRVWVPDRPGALGQVASRIGAVRGDVVGIEILERGAGRAIDELVVSLPDASLVELLVQEIGQVDGVDVEDVRPLPDADRDLRVEALETAARLVEARSVPELLERLCAEARPEFDAEWVAVLRITTGDVLAGAGDVPSPAWLRAFVEGSRFSSHTSERPGAAHAEDVAWSSLTAGGLEVVLGRQGRPLRSRERRQLDALARIADARVVELSAQVG